MVVACSLTDDTRGMFNESAFAKMKKTSILINIARGGIVNQDDLITALKVIFWNLLEFEGNISAILLQCGICLSVNHIKNVFIAVWKNKWRRTRCDDPWADATRSSISKHVKCYFAPTYWLCYSRDTVRHVEACNWQSTGRSVWQTHAVRAKRVGQNQDSLTVNSWLITIQNGF